MNAELDWELIGDVARSLGVRDRALEKWRERKSVPHKWRLPIIRQSEGRISLDAFDNFPAEEVR